MLLLELVNNGSAAAHVTLTDAYGNDCGRGLRLAAGARDELSIRTDRAHGWYDVRVSVQGDAAYLRRLAGHVETGRSSSSDPAIATR